VRSTGTGAQVTLGFASRAGVDPKAVVLIAPFTSLPELLTT
jgi:hypothetical protein